MNDFKHRIQSNQLLTIGTCIILGVVLHLGNTLILAILSPVPIYIGMIFIDQSSSDIWLQTALLNILFTAFCGFLITIVMLQILNFLFKPASMFTSNITALPYIALSYWWFIQDINGMMQAVSIEQIWISLLSPLAAILVWFYCAWRMVQRNRANSATKPVATLEG
ncbi:hypothetical protein ACFL3U_04345 [Pseudomonadota bacterium]